MDLHAQVSSGVLLLSTWWWASSSWHTHEVGRLLLLWLLLLLRRGSENHVLREQIWWTHQFSWGRTKARRWHLVLPHLLLLLLLHDLECLLLKK